MAFSRRIKVIPENWNTIIIVLRGAQRDTKVRIAFFLADADHLEITTRSLNYYRLAVKALKINNCLPERRQVTRSSAHPVEPATTKQATKPTAAAPAGSGYKHQSGDNTNPLSYGR